ncbi:hypothetical protein V6615_01015 [Oscillospiraceae bacterium PP1C4]
MTTEQIITLAKEKLGKDITEREAQDYIDGKAAIPDEALDIVSGGGRCSGLTLNMCPNCCLPNTSSTYTPGDMNRHFTCHSCGYQWAVDEATYRS